MQTCEIIISSPQEAIGLLVTCHKFEIEGGAATIRKMLPLTFSREQGPRLFPFAVLARR